MGVEFNTLSTSDREADVKRASRLDCIHEILEAPQVSLWVNWITVTTQAEMLEGVQAREGSCADCQACHYVLLGEGYVFTCAWSWADVQNLNWHERGHM